MTVIYNVLLWIFTQLPGDYIVLDTETTGLPVGNGPPDIVTISITVVRRGEIAESVEIKTRPRKQVSAEAQATHGIFDEQAAEFESFEAQWDQIAKYMEDQLIVIHNASFAWPILQDHVARYRFSIAPVQGYFAVRKQPFPGHKR